MKRNTLLVLLVFVMLSGCVHVCKKYTPEEGLWYCEELQAQMNFTIDPNMPEVDATSDMDEVLKYVVDREDNYVMVDGEKISCDWSSYNHSDRIHIVSQDSDTEAYEMGELIYELWVVSLSDTQYVLKDEDGKEYTFVRTD